jgi:PRTRC genetic system ThiF family protein
MLLANNWVVNPTHRLSVALIGVGGTGSFILPELVALSNALVSMDRKPLKIYVYDDDKVESHNVGRQKYFPTDIGRYKAETLVNRVNRAYGADVEFLNKKFTEESLRDIKHNIIISCVDTVDSRKQILNGIEQFSGWRDGYQKVYYWIDCGNSRDYGQIILGAFGLPRNGEGKKVRKIVKNGWTKNVIQRHPDMQDKPQEPSCSMRAALNEQSFMINKLTGVYALEILASLLLDFNITYSEVYFSLFPVNVKTNKI